MSIAALLHLAVPGAVNAQVGGMYWQTNRVSNLAGVAKFQDPNPVNAWGLSHSPTGLSIRYKGNGMGDRLIVTIPLPGGGFGEPQRAMSLMARATSSSRKAVPLVLLSSGSAIEDGTLSGWNPNVDLAHTLIAVDRSKVRQGKYVGAVYKGLAMEQNSSGNFLFATDFRFGTIEMFNATFTLVNSRPELCFLRLALLRWCTLDCHGATYLHTESCMGNHEVSYSEQREETR